MKYSFAFLIALALGISCSYAASPVIPGYTTNGTNFIDVSPTTPLPVTGLGNAPAAPAAPTATQSFLMGCQYLATVPNYSDTWQGGVRCDQDGALIAYAPPLIISGNITTQNLNPGGAATAGSAVEISLDGRSQVTVQTVGTWTGTLVPQVTDDGVNWITQGSNPMLRESTGAYSQNIASAVQDIYNVDVAGHNKFRISASAAISGSVVATIVAGPGSSRVNIGYQPSVSVPTWGGGTLGAMANYGTSPGAVLVPGVNAYVTNPITISGLNYTNVTTITNLTVKAASGVFGGLTVNTVGNLSSVTIYDGLTCAGTKIGTFSTTAQTALTSINAATTTGLCVTNTGTTTPADITILWR